MNIRQEQPNDYEEVYELVRKSFSTASYSDGDEQDYLNGLRKSENFIPELSLVVENDDGKIIGQIVLYKMIIVTANGHRTELVLSPICVHPDYFRRGIARAMMEHALRIADSLGYNAVFLCGDPNIYKKLGFRPSYEYNIIHCKDKEKNTDWCMVREIKKGLLDNVKGTIDIV